MNGNPQDVESGQGYRLDRRTAAELVAAFARSARSAQLPPWLLADDLGYRTWADLLFDEDQLGDPSEPSQALLAAFAEAHGGLLDHLNTLPARAREWYVTERLGILRMPAPPDRVVAVAEGDPKQPPAVIAAGAELRAKDPEGGERRFATTANLTVLGAGIRGVRGHRAEPDSDIDVVARHDGAVDEPFSPFDEDGIAAHHDLVLTSPLLSFAARSEQDALRVHLEFRGLTARDALAALRWTYSTASDEEATATVVGTFEVDAQWWRVSLLLRGAGCEPGQVGGDRECYVRGAFRTGAAFDREAAFGVSFTDVRLWTQRQAADAALPDSAAHNAGLLDVGREFEPFGPVPQRGDAFYVRCDEAFGKPLQEFTVHLDIFTEPGAQPQPAVYPPQMLVHFGNLLAEALGEEAPDSGPLQTRLVWERFDGRAWDSLRSTTALETTNVPEVRHRDVASREAAVAGVDGHWIRAFLQNGDFGWTAYLRTLAQLASAAAGEGEVPPADRLVPPDPPVVSVATVSYRTKVEAPTAIRSRNGLHDVARQATVADPARPFERRPFTEHLATATGELVVGLDLDGSRLGSTVAFFLGLESGAVCRPWDAARMNGRWEFRAEEGWRPIDVLDGTRSLRQSGIVRFAAPLDWSEGAPDLGERAGRWMRAVLPAPEAAGAVVALLPDAVEAREVVDHRVELPATRPSLPVGAVSGLVAAVPGIKAVTNPLPSSGAPGTEPRTSLFPRSASRLAHRGRAVTSLGIEAHVRHLFPEVAVVRCLPHTSFDSSQAPGWVAVVLIPRDTGGQPLPSIDLSERVAAELRGVATPHLRVAVRCPAYVPVRVDATVRLRRGQAAAAALPALDAALERFLHPLRRSSDEAAGFGRPLYRSELVALLEGHPAVAHLEELRLQLPADDPDRVDVDPCLGMVASAGEHRIVAVEAP